MNCEASLVVFTSEDLKLCTNNFHKSKLIGSTQFGKLYRGQIKQQQGFIIGSHAGDVTVKIWDERASCTTFTTDEMVKEEVVFLTQPSIKGHPNLVKLIGYCFEKEVKGVVYDLSPWDTLHNLTPQDSLSWVQRVNVLLQLAKLLEFLHDREKPYVVLNTNTSHMLLDWECKPILVDFGLISGGIIGEMTPLKKKMSLHTIGFVDPFLAAKGGNYWDTSCDVFSFGVILLGLIAKRNSELGKEGKSQLGLDSLVHNWAKNVYRPSLSLVHRSLQEDWSYFGEDGSVVTELGMSCVEFFPVNRPTMKKVVKCLEDLLVFRRLEDARPYKREKIFHGKLT